MSRVAVTSDLHLGITPVETIRRLAQDIAAERPDLTILAGDLGERLENAILCLTQFQDLPGEVAVLGGNHDVWARGGHSSQELWEHDLPAAVREAGMIWLEDAVWHRDGTAVLGSLAWYDYSAVDPHFASRGAAEFAARKREFNLDGVKIDWPWDDVTFAKKLGDDLCARLDMLEGDAGIRAIMLVTHVPLFEEQMLRRPEDPRWGYTNAYFGNLTLGRRVIGADKLRVVVSGHTHVGREGIARRPQSPDSPGVPVVVLASDYHKPVYRIVDTGAWT